LVKKLFLLTNSVNRFGNVYLSLSMLGCGLGLVEAGEATIVPVNEGR
jgi:hypothetical protein